MQIHKRHAWGTRADGRLELYAADVHALSAIAKHPRRFRRMGRRVRGHVSTIRRFAASLRSRERSLRTIDQDRLPVVLIFDRGGRDAECYLATDGWREVRARLQEVA